MPESPTQRRLSSLSSIHIGTTGMADKPGESKAIATNGNGGHGPAVTAAVPRVSVADQLIGAPAVMTETPRRFCAHADSLLPTAIGRSLPKLMVVMRLGSTPWATR